MKRILLIIGFTVVILLASIYYLGEQKQASVLQVQVVVKGNNNSATIEGITAHLEQVNKISVPKGTPLITPSVTLVVLQNMRMIGEWTSVPYNGSGVYNLKVGLTKYTKPGETVRVTARVLNAESQNIAVVSKEITLT